MAGKGVLLSCWSLLFVALAVFVLLPNSASLVIDVGDSLRSGASLRANQSIISKNGTFRLGFFSPDGSNNWYVGIWYARILDENKTIVWVANRESPMKTIPGVLILATDGRLKLFDSEGHSIWSSGNKAKASRALLKDSGNFVMLGNNNNPETVGESSEYPDHTWLPGTVWESFEFPGDTWLPGMKIWKGKRLTSWKSSIDPTPGPFSLGMDPSLGETQYLLLYENKVQYWSSGEWSGERYANLPEMLQKDMFDIPFVNFSRSRMYFTYKPTPKIQKLMPRIVMHTAGEIQAYFLLNEIWNPIWYQPRDQCSVYNFCGAFGACQNDNIQFCSCLQGFNPKNRSSWDSKEWWSSGCVRRSPLDCSVTNGTTDGFLEVSGKFFPDDHSVSYDREQTLQGCRTLCLKNCSCTAFAMTANYTPICQLWFGDLLNVRNSPFAHSLHVRLAVSELRHSSSKKRSGIAALSIVIPTVVAFIAVLALIFGLLIRKRRRRLLTKREEDDLPTSLKTFTYKELRIATRNFSQKLGSGAFGSVFKGTLADNTLVAVKRIESCAHAEDENARPEMRHVVTNHVKVGRRVRIMWLRIM